MKSLNDLLAYSPEQRDRNWEDHFFSELTKSSVELLSEDPITGPDQWPYLLVKTRPGESDLPISPSTSSSASPASDAVTEPVSAPVEAEPVQKILAWLADKGIGLVVNPEQEYPDYVFPYGMIWHFRESGLFFRDQAEIPTGSVMITSEKGLKAGPPTEAFLPSYVRKVLKEFFANQGLYAVKILVLQSEAKAEGMYFYDLAFSLESLGSPVDAEYAGIAEAISWFLPPHYSVLLAQEKGLPPFVDL
jgi:hypothetical protein